MEYTIQTSMGDIDITLFEDKAPITAKNFADYAEAGFFDGTIFHRVIKNFMIQGGGFDTDFEEKETNEPITNEADNGLSNKRGTLAMARTMVVDSATAQFFINTVDNNFLDFQAPTPRDFGYCVFGEVTNGLEVVDAIQDVKTGNRGGHGDVPKDDIIIKKVVKKESK